jgi:hypothetical protein
MRRLVAWIDGKVESPIASVYGLVIRPGESPPNVWVKLAVVAVIVGLVVVALAVDQHID